MSTGLAEQGLKGDALEGRSQRATEESLSGLKDDPAFARFAADAAFAQAAGFSPRARAAGGK